MCDVHTVMAYQCIMHVCVCSCVSRNCNFCTRDRYSRPGKGCRAMVSQRISITQSIAENECLDKESFNTYRIIFQGLTYSKFEQGAIALS